MQTRTTPAFDSNVYLAVEAATQAGAYLRSQSAVGVQVLEATRRDIKVTADLAAERLIRGCLGDRLAILGEEAGWSGQQRPGTDHWVIDGLDGTVNLACGIPFAAVSIGLVRDGKPHIGVVYDFFHDELFVGEKGVGAVLNNRRIQVSKAAAASSALLLSAVATGRNFDTESLAAFGVSLGRWRKVRMLGSAAISLAYVAAGRADACAIAGIMEWDIVAGLALVEAAGGITHLAAAGAPHTFDLYAHNGLIAR